MDSSKRQDLILKHLPYARGIAFRMCWNRNSSFHLFDDCMSVATEALIEAIDSYDVTFGASLKTWITHNVRGLVMNFIRGEKSWRWQTTNIDDHSNSSELSSDGLEQMLCDKDLLYRILLFVDRVKAGRTRKKEVEDFLAYFMEGYSLNEIADWRGCMESNVSLMIAGLRKTIEKRFGGI